MAKQERKGVERVEMYDAPDSAIPGNRYDTTDDVMFAGRPKDLVRWGSILAGIFAALATLITLSLLGIAIGLSSFNYGDPASSFGIGAGIWGAITALIAFFIGGLIAARSAAYGGRNSGIINGAMVWFVAIPLLVYLLSSGIGALTRTAGSVVSSVGQVVAPAVGQMADQAANDPALQATAQVGAQDAGQTVQATAQALADNVTPQDVNQATGKAADGAWGALLSLGLAAAAAIGGGVAGTRPTRTPVARA